MRHLRCGPLLAAALLSQPVLAAGPPQQGKTISDAVLHQSPVLPPLELSDAQRAQIRQAVMQQRSEVSFAIKAAKPDKDFQPAVGEKLAKGLQAHPLPRPLVDQLPALKRFTYVKFKDDVLIVNPMTKMIVEVIPQAIGR
jgi:hypothetical protein